MGKISVAANSKKEREDVVGLVTPQKEKKTHKDRDRETQHGPNQPPSPTPRRPLNKAKGGCCCRVCLFTLGVFVVTILFAAFACFLDYQQGHGHLADQTSRMSKELKDKSKYIVEVFYQTPKNLDSLIKEIWKEGNNSDIRMGNETPHQDNSKVLNGSNPGDKKENHEGEDDIGFPDIGQFFAGLLYDVGSIFAPELNKSERVEVPVNADMYDPRTVDKEELEDNDVFLSEGIVGEVPGLNGFEFTTERTIDWEEAFEDNEEIYIDEYIANPVSSKEDFLNATSDKHYH